MLKIRHARLDERKTIYEWLCCSDTTPLHMGPPNYPHIPVPGYEEYLEDFSELYFRKKSQNYGSVLIIEIDRKAAGALCYACFHLKKNTAELDIWMKSLEFCGKGYGSAALRKLIEYLYFRKQITRFLIRPSAKNLRAISAYRKAGFRFVQNKTETLKSYLKTSTETEYLEGDYGFDETAVLTLEIASADSSQKDLACANCGHLKSAHQSDGKCFYQGSSFSACEPCRCVHFESADDFNSRNPYAP